MKKIVIITSLFVCIFYLVNAQGGIKAEATEFYSPVPPVVTPGAALSDPPSDAIILFNGKNLDQWINTKDSASAKWILADNVMTVNKSTGDIQTRASFSDFQLHIEYRIP